MGKFAPGGAGRCMLVAAFVLCAWDVAAEEGPTVSPALSPVALLNRCYTQLTRRKLPRRSRLRAAVSTASGALDACMTLLEAASLEAGGSREGYLAADTETARAVLRTFNDFHRGWFPNNDLPNSVLDCGELCPKIAELHDGGESALHLTRVLFGHRAYSDVVTLDTGVEALRTNGPAANGTRVTFLGAAAPGSGEFVPLSTELVQTGELLGIRKISLNPEKRDASGFTGYGGYPNAIPLHASLGGGILGSQSYLQLNLGRPDLLPANGGSRMARRWSRAVFTDLLCRDVPAVRPGDVALYVQTSPGPATPSFRTSASCMGCHASLDPMAATVRNVSYAMLPLSLLEVRKVASGLYPWGVDPTLPREPGQVDDDPQFHRRPPFGRLFFRSYKGELIHRVVSGVPGLGQALAETDDLYVCAASRYFRFFTGIQVSLQDPGDPSASPLSLADEGYRNFVIELGLELKQHQSLTRLVRRIFDSEIYQRSELRALGASEREGEAP